MTKQHLKRMNWVFMERWLDLFHEATQQHANLPPSEQLNRASSKWGQFCRAMGIDMANHQQDYDYGGQILEELDALADPCPNGLWLEMSHETAEKILTLGLP